MSNTDNGQRGETAEQKRAWLEWFERQRANYFWCLSQPDILARYAGQVVILHEHAILGSGPDSEQALQNARQHAESKGESLPADRELLTVPIPTQGWIEDTMLPPHFQPQETPLSSQEGQRG